MLKALPPEGQRFLISLRKKLNPPAARLAPRLADDRSSRVDRKARRHEHNPRGVRGFEPGPDRCPSDGKGKFARSRGACAFIQVLLPKQERSFWLLVTNTRGA